MRNHVQYYMEISTVLFCTKCIVNDVFWSYLYLRFRLFSLELMFGNISSWNAEVYSYFLQLSKVVMLNGPLGKLIEFLIPDFNPATLMFYEVL